MTDLKTVSSVADILERESEPTIKDWLRRVNQVPSVTKVPLSDLDRTGHLPLENEGHMNAVELWGRRALGLRGLAYMFT
jgi:hypothetical protein